MIGSRKKRMAIIMLVGIFLAVGTYVYVDATALVGGLNTMYAEDDGVKTVHAYVGAAGSHTDEIKEAIERWNSTGLVNIRYTNDKSQADIVFYKSNKEFSNRTIVGETKMCESEYNSAKQRYCTPTSVDNQWDYVEIYGYANEMAEVDYTREEIIKVYTHEIGHALGLGHTPEEQCELQSTSSVMCSGRNKSSHPTNYDNTELYNKWY